MTTPNSAAPALPASIRRSQFAIRSIAGASSAASSAMPASSGTRSAASRFSVSVWRAVVSATETLSFRARVSAMRAWRVGFGHS